MIVVCVLDPHAARYKRAVLQAARILSRTLNTEKKCVEIFLVGDAQMPKNVLAYPADPRFPRPDLAEPSLGEIYLNPGYITAHPLPLPFATEKAKWTLDPQLAYMLVHGFLHLLGYDHVGKSDRIKMEKREFELLRQLAQ